MPYFLFPLVVNEMGGLSLRVFASMPFIAADFEVAPIGTTRQDYFAADEDDEDVEGPNSDRRPKGSAACNGMCGDTEGEHAILRR